jgi:hypothetical protein
MVSIRRLTRAGGHKLVIMSAFTSASTTRHLNTSSAGSNLKGLIVPDVQETKQDEQTLRS